MARIFGVAQLVLVVLIACVHQTHTETADLQADEFAQKTLPSKDEHRQLSTIALFQLEATQFNKLDPIGAKRNRSYAESYDPHEYDLDCYFSENPTGNSILTTLYTSVCVIGLFGNTLVIYVVLRFSKMQTVTNIYILNLAIADECFLIGIPFLLYTMQNGSWPFGEYVCKAYMVSTSVTQFTSSIFLLIMSADRYIAVCHAISSPRYRTATVAKAVSALAWLTSALLMLPVMLFASTVQHGDHASCNIKWPEAQHKQSSASFILYALTLGFAVPLTFILIFYCLVIRKLHTVGPQHKSTERKRSHRKVTRLVLTVIAVYILCWLPYWVAQLALIHSSPAQCASQLEIMVHLLVGCLGYSNSAMNPLMYAFLSDNFRKCFAKAFWCVASPRHSRPQQQVPAEPHSRHSKRKQQDAMLSRLTTGTTTNTTACPAATSTNNYGTVGIEGGATGGGGRGTALGEPHTGRGSSIAEIFAVFGGTTATTTMVDALSEESSSCGSSSAHVMAVNINLLVVAENASVHPSSTNYQDNGNDDDDLFEEEDDIDEVKGRSNGCVVLSSVRKGAGGAAFTTTMVDGLNGNPPFLQTDL